MSPKRTDLVATEEDFYFVVWRWCGLAARCTEGLVFNPLTPTVAIIFLGYKYKASLIANTIIKYVYSCSCHTKKLGNMFLRVLPPAVWILILCVCCIVLMVLSILSACLCSFYARHHISYSAYMLSPVRPSVRLSFRPSVTRVDHTKTIEVGIIKFSPYGSPIPLVFREQVSSRNAGGFPQSGCVKWGWGR